MSNTHRILALLAAVTMLVAGLVIPVQAANDTEPAKACVVAAGSFNAVRASLTPTGAIEEDRAFNHDDPDAEDSPLALIRYPGETALWISARVGENGNLMAGSDALNATAIRGDFAVPERSDPEVSDSIVRLFCALFDREPTSLELEYWAARYWNGLPLVTIAEAFTHSREFVDRFGELSDEALISILYSDVLGREPGVGGAEALTTNLASGEMHRGQVIVQFTESGEYVRATATAAPEKPILPYPEVGSGRRILYSMNGQRVWLIDESGELHNTHQVSGRRGIPSLGRYNIYSMSRYAWAPHDGITMEYMVRFARGEWPYGFHSIPIHPDDTPLQTPAQLGTHRSGGCVRQLWDDAKGLFEWATVGTRVIVFNEDA